MQTGYDGNLRNPCRRLKSFVLGSKKMRYCILNRKGTMQTASQFEGMMNRPKDSIRTMKTIFTPRLQLISCSLEIFEAIFQGDESLARRLNIRVSGNWSEFGLEPIRYGYRALENDPSLEGWWTHLVVHSTENRLIGTCGYKGKPDVDGLVEIGYEVMEAYRNKGIGTEIAQGLIKNAFSRPGLRIVQAHTLATENASAGVLRKCGFTFVKEYVDPDDGPIWQWRLEKTVFEKR